MVRKHDGQVRVFTRRGADWTKRFPRYRRGYASTQGELGALGRRRDRVRRQGFALLHSREYDKEVSLAAFDLLEHDGGEVRKLKLLVRKKRLARLLGKVKDGIEFNDHIVDDGNLVLSTPASSAARASWPSGSISPMKAEGLDGG
jgi:ATP-dependent DNA ligase